MLQTVYFVVDACYCI